MTKSQNQKSPEIYFLIPELGHIWHGTFTGVCVQYLQNNFDIKGRIIRGTNCCYCIYMCQFKKFNLHPAEGNIYQSGWTLAWVGRQSL